VISNARLRGACSSLSGIFQQSRALAIKQNTPMTVYFTSLNLGPYAYVKNSSSTNSSMGTVDPRCRTTDTCSVVQLGAPIIQVTTPSGGVSQLDPAVLGYTPLNYPDVPSFNSRGLPCKYSAGACVNSGFAYYFTDVRRGKGWTAVSISPAGRITRWFWYGSSWGN
jgi:hypothetical protein